MVTTSEGITSSLAILVFLMVQGTAGSSLLQGIAEPAPPAPLAHSGAASSRSACVATVRSAARWPLTHASHRPAAPHSACCRSERALSHMANIPVRRLAVVALGAAPETQRDPRPSGTTLTKYARMLRNANA